MVGLRLLDLWGGVRIAFQRLELVHVLGLGAAELLFAVAHRDVGSRPAQCDGVFQRRITAADHEHVLARKIFRVVQTVGDFVQVIPRHPESVEIPALADGHDHPPRLDRQRIILREMDRHSISAGFDALGACAGDLDARVLALPLQFIEERFLHVSVELHVSRRCHVGGIRVDRLCLGKIDDGGKRLGGLEHLEPQSRLFRFQRRRYSRYPSADDREVQQAAVAGVRLEIRFLQDRLDGARPGVRRKFQQRDAAQVPDDPYSC